MMEPTDLDSFPIPPAVTCPCIDNSSLRCIGYVLYYAYYLECVCVCTEVMKSISQEMPGSVGRNVFEFAPNGGGMRLQVIQLSPFNNSLNP